MKICPKCRCLNEDTETLCKACGEVLDIMCFIYNNNLPIQYFYNYD